MNLKNETGDRTQQAWVVFTGQTELPWLRLFKKGFRHCFVILHDGEHWISLDPLSTYTEVTVHKLPSEFNLPLWLQSRGHTVVKTPLRRTHQIAPFMAFTCVEAVKRVIGLHKRFVMTPWQLYRYLREEKATASPSHQHSSYQGDLSWEV